VVGYVKGVSSRLMHMHFDYLQHVPSLWSDGFFVSTVGANESVMRRYIKFQDKQEYGQAEIAN